MKRTFGYRFLEPAALARVRNLPLIARGVVEGFVSGLHSSPYKGFSAEFADHREYSPGDSPRHLDWRTLARTDRLYIKQYEEETNLRAQILFDISGSMAYGKKGTQLFSGNEPQGTPHKRAAAPFSKFEYGAYLTAVLAYLMTRQQDAVGLTTFDTELRLDMPQRSSARHLGEILQQLERTCRTVEGAGDRPSHGTDVAGTLHRLADRYKRRCLVVLISDLFDAPDAVARALHHFRHRRHEVIVFHVFDKAELDFPFRETMSFLDMETGERLQIDPSYVRDDYCRQIREFIAGYRRSCADLGIDYVMTDTSVPYDLMLSRYLAKRSRL